MNMDFTFASEELTNKVRQTLNEKYGVDDLGLMILLHQTNLKLFLKMKKFLNNKK